MYNYFDSIVCISLEEATERREQCIKNFEKLGIDNYQFYKTQRHKEGGRFGCFISHINIIKKEYDKGSNNILIFEDDFMLSSSYDENVIKEVIDFIDNRELDIMYLGHSSACNHRPFYTPERITKHVYKMKPCFTHAYTVSRKGMEKILKAASIYLEKTEPKNVIHYDTFLYDTLDQSYAVLPLQFLQNMCAESFNSEDASISEKILRLVPFFMKKSGLSKTCDASYGLSLLLYYNKLILSVLLIVLVYFYVIKKSN